MKHYYLVEQLRQAPYFNVLEYSTTQIEKPNHPYRFVLEIEEKTSCLADFEAASILSKRAEQLKQVELKCDLNKSFGKFGKTIETELHTITLSPINNTNVITFDPSERWYNVSYKSIDQYPFYVHHKTNLQSEGTELNTTNISVFAINETEAYKKSLEQIHKLTLEKLYKKQEPKEGKYYVRYYINHEGKEVVLDAFTEEYYDEFQYDYNGYIIITNYVLASSNEEAKEKFYKKLKDESKSWIVFYDKITKSLHHLVEVDFGVNLYHLTKEPNTDHTYIDAITSTVAYLKFKATKGKL